MKFSIALLFTLLICVSEYVSAAKFHGAFEKVLKKHVHLSLDEFKEECEAHPKSLMKKLHECQIVADKTAYALADDVLKRVEKLPKVGKKDWYNIVDDRCCKNAALKVLNDMSVDNTNKCLNGKNHLKGEKKAAFSKDLWYSYCEQVEKLAKEMYAEKRH